MSLSVLDISEEATATWAHDELRVLIDTIVRVEDEHYRHDVEILDLQIGERWLLYQTDRNGKKITPHRSDHSGSPIFKVLAGDIYRFDMNGTMTQLTDSGDVIDIDWR